MVQCNSQQPTANSQQPTANSQQPTANSQQPTANSWTSWESKFSITEPDALLAVENNAIDKIRILKRDDDFIILLTLSWRADELFLSTIRNRKEPRLFKHAGRLIEYIQANFTTKEVTLILD